MEQSVSTLSIVCAALSLAAAVGLPAAAGALALGVLLAGGAAAAWLLSGRAGRGALLPYGAFLALGGIVVLVLGA